MYLKLNLYININLSLTHDDKSSIIIVYMNFYGGGDTLSEKELIELLKNGDRDAFNELINQYQSKVINISYGLLSDREDALDASIDKIIRQIRKNKTKIEKRLKDTAFKEAFTEPVTEQIDYEVIKHKKFEMRPMDVEEAILQMNMLGHNFFMFSNASTGNINVVYKRAEGNYAVLEPNVV